MQFNCLGLGLGLGYFFTSHLLPKLSNNFYKTICDNKKALTPKSVKFTHIDVLDTLQASVMKSLYKTLNAFKYNANAYWSVVPNADTTVFITFYLAS